MMKQQKQAVVKVTLTGLTLLLILGIHQVQGGCSRFGHSCFGAHGKRAESVVPGSSVDLNVPTAGELAYGQPLRDLYNSFPQQQQPPSRYLNRMSPYLFEWALAAQRAADMRQPISKEDIAVEMRKK
ncbi:unnamed protein product [Allacma fusca]|uniref:Uncharacterized protein n=1 Tax=Allacma fusca TaxID=39272 RepID=A0A8J2LFD2_9HEXA|nr:unnamed protein product [Allacma fusca]